MNNYTGKNHCIFRRQRTEDDLIFIKQTTALIANKHPSFHMYSRFASSSRMLGDCINGNAGDAEILRAGAQTY